ncbi:hypothetical protein P8452_09073 [Trifolium repens]|nr:hypothetical protein P8452_09073 [Trifolium repens]
MYYDKFCNDPQTLNWLQHSTSKVTRIGKDPSAIFDQLFFIRCLQWESVRKINLPRLKSLLHLTVDQTNNQTNIHVYPNLAAMQTENALKLCLERRRMRFPLHGRGISEFQLWCFCIFLFLFCFGIKCSSLILDQRSAMMTAKTFIFLRLVDQTEIPASCKSAFDVVCSCMEERLSQSNTEKFTSSHMLTLFLFIMKVELPLEFPDGTTPVTCRVCVSIYDSSSGKKIGVGSLMDKASAPPLPTGSIYMEEVHVKL